MAIANQPDSVQRILKALGLERVRSLSIHFEVNSLTTVEATFTPSNVSLDGIADAFESKRYRLLELDEGNGETADGR
jgi:hypothetical protein